MKFYGNEICCGSYACFNAMKDKKIDLHLFEMSTSAPFGIRHFENAQFDRLLTTYCDPCKGMDWAFGIWGYRIQKYAVSTAEEAVEILREKLIDHRAVLGPVDMGELGYQAVPWLLKRMDHYVALERWSEEKVLCHDSEGFCGYLLDYAELKKYISIKEIPESEGVITIRFVIKKEEGRDTAYILKKIYGRAFQNLKDAEAEGQGSEAIKHCFEFLKGQDVYLWKLSLLYDIQYLMQRKWLMKELAEIVRDKSERINVPYEKIVNLVDRQIETAGQIYNDLSQNGKLENIYFAELGDCEKQLAELY
ncbi:MAG: hypothetical protein HFH12_10165 [Dorea sp.]|nr:hypothetical protein [Dorea sp.]